MRHRISLTLINLYYQPWARKPSCSAPGRHPPCEARPRGPLDFQTPLPPPFSTTQDLWKRPGSHATRSWGKRLNVRDVALACEGAYEQDDHVLLLLLACLLSRHVLLVHERR